MSDWVCEGENENVGAAAVIVVDPGVVVRGKMAQSASTYPRVLHDDAAKE